MNSDIDLKNRTNTVIATGVFALTPLSAMIIGGTFPMTEMILCAALVGIALIVRRSGSPVADYVLSACLVGTGIATTAAMAGLPWQIDAHMLFFVQLALVSVFGKAGPLLFAAGFIAVHHLSLTFLMPALVYPSDDLWVNLERTVFHAIVVVIETAALLVVLKLRNDLSALAERHLDEARRAAEAAEDARFVAEASEQAAQDMALATTDTVAVLSKALSRMAERDLSGRIEEALPDGYEGLRRDFNTAVQELSDALAQAAAAARDFHTDSSSVAAASAELAGSVERQAAELNNIMTTMSAVDEGLGRVVNALGTARASSEAATRNVDDTSRIMNDAAGAMEEIESSAQEINKIVQIINDIAFQTNLLALNAGVEAARAGERGAGFAVVANEVRELAKRTSESANSIGSLIASSNAQVAKGVEIVGTASRALDAIREELSGAFTLIADANDKAREQSDALRSVDGMVQRVEGSAGSGASLAEELSAMGDRMAAGAQHLSSTLARVRIAGSGVGSTAKKGAAARRAA